MLGAAADPGDLAALRDQPSVASQTSASSSNQPPPTCRPRAAT